MNELKQFTDNIEKIITESEEISACFRELSQVLGKKSYKSKLNEGMEFGCEELISKNYKVGTIEKELSFINEIHSHPIGIKYERFLSK